jgi:Flp pilus assembly pilin Flp
MSLPAYPTKSARLRKPPSRVRGAVMTEYTVLIGSVALAASFALVGLGWALVDLFEMQQSLLLMPVP